MTFSFAIVYCAVFPKLEQFYLKLIIILSFGLSMIFGIISWLLDPGFIEKDKSMDYLGLLEQFEPHCLCPECQVIRTPRSRHCNVCDRCVDRFDHHCPWINNCVGIKNHSVFLLFIISVLIYILAIVVVSFLSFTNDYPSSEEEEGGIIKDFPDCCPFFIEMIPEPYNEVVSKIIFCALIGSGLAFFVPVVMLVFI